MLGSQVTARPRFSPQASPPGDDQAIAALLDQADLQAAAAVAEQTLLLGAGGVRPPLYRRPPVMSIANRARTLKPATKKKPEVSMEDLKKKIQKFLDGAEGCLDARSELNNICQVLCRRPTAKGDVVVEHQRGHQESLTMKILPLDLEVNSTFQAGIRLGPVEKKQAEHGLASAAIRELLNRIEGGELTIPTEPLKLPSEGLMGTVPKPADVSSVAPKVHLTAVLQKLKPGETDNQVFSVDVLAGYGSLNLTTLEPPVFMECTVADLPEDADPAAGEEARLQDRFEQHLAQMALEDLVARRVVAHHPTDSSVNAYRPVGMKLVAEAPKQRQPGARRLRDWQDSWKPAENDVLEETSKCRPDGMSGKVWEVRITLQSEQLTGGQQIEGNGVGDRQVVAFEEAAEELMLQVEEVLGILPPEPVEPRGLKRPFPADQRTGPPARFAKGGGKGWGYKGGGAGKGFQQRPWFGGKW